jgi:hypothetical protein
MAWLLMQRKQELLNWTITIVTVFWAEYEVESRGKHPSLLRRID